MIRIAQQREIQLLLGFKLRLRFDGVGAHPEDGYAQLVKLFLCVTKLGRFDRSTGSIRFRIKKQHHALALEIAQRKTLPLA
jgi:hypothetical protein